jgi:hypothetical protein
MQRQQGSIIIFEIVLIFIASLVILPVLGNATAQFRLTRTSVNREQALDIAEAGVNYYQWRLAHFANDFKDGTGAAPTAHPPFPNPCYEHTYTDTDSGKVFGKYCLEITAPPAGSTIVTIKSTGYAAANPSVRRAITARYGIPSLAKYAFLTNADVWIGDTESVSGQMHANGGIRFDGTGNAPIISAKTTYPCTPIFGCCPTATKAGIWGAAPQSTKNFWQFPQPNVDFSSITSDLATIRTNAISSGIYLAPSAAQGYSLVFKNNGTVDVYKINSLQNNPTGYDTNFTLGSGCSVNLGARNDKLDYSSRTLQGNYAIPANGLIFVEDKVWVEGTVRGRALVAAAKLGSYDPATAPNIMIPNNIVYTAKDGTDVLGLIAQKDVIISYRAPNTLEIDAAMIAQNGVANFFYFAGQVKTSLTIYGAVASFGVWTWSWNNPVNAGYTTTSTTYDANLLYGPPPSFPLTSNGYQQISWSSDN